MLKKRIVAVLAGLALLAAVTGSGIVANSMGWAVTSQTHACSSSGTGGGSC